MIWLLALLVLSGQVWAQPVEGPWEIVLTGNAVTSPEVCVRGGEADVLWIENDSVRYARFSLATHQLVAGPDIIFGLQGWHTQGLHELIPVNDSTWACLVYEDEQPMLPGDDNNLYNRTDLIIGNSITSSALALDSGLTHWYYPQFGEYWNYGFSLKHRAGGGLAAGWIKATFFQFDLSMCFHFRSFEADFSQDYWAEDCVGIGYIFEKNRVIPQSVTADSFLVLAAPIPLYSAITTSENNYYSGAYWQSDCNFSAPLAFGRTHGGDLHAVVCDEDWDCNPQSLALEITGDNMCTCTSLGSVDLPPGNQEALWHPDFGFALLHASPNSLLLARVDTTGAQFLPTGTLFWRDEAHTFSEPNLTIADDGLIVALWTEIQDGDTAARRLMMGTVGWDTPLTSHPAAFIPRPSFLELSAYPNPFNGETRITYDLPQAGNVDLAIYNLLGERVATLRHGIEQAGSHAVQWRPEVSSGIYFAQIEAGASTMMRKVVYLR